MYNVSASSMVQAQTAAVLLLTRIFGLCTCSLSALPWTKVSENWNLIYLFMWRKLWISITHYQHVLIHSKKESYRDIREELLRRFRCHTEALKYVDYFSHQRGLMQVTALRTHDERTTSRWSYGASWDGRSPCSPNSFNNQIYNVFSLCPWQTACRSPQLWNTSARALSKISRACVTSSSFTFNAGKNRIDSLAPARITWQQHEPPAYPHPRNHALCKNTGNKCVSLIRPDAV